MAIAGNAGLLGGIEAGGTKFVLAVGHSPTEIIARHEIPTDAPAITLAEAAAWGLFLRWTRLIPSLTEGIYFTAATITTLGYGDILLKYPWRHLGTLIAITGVLMFGCSTAFLFVLLQDVWVHHFF